MEEDDDDDDDNGDDDVNDNDDEAIFHFRKDLKDVIRHIVIHFFSQRGGDISI